MTTNSNLIFILTIFSSIVIWLKVYTKVQRLVEKLISAHLSVGPRGVWYVKRHFVKSLLAISLQFGLIIALQVGLALVFLQVLA